MKPVPGRSAFPPRIDVQIQSPQWARQPMAEQTAREAVMAAAGALSTGGGEVSIVLTDDATIRSLNRDWRGIDKPTNVLSFPSASGAGPLDGETGRMLGDIVVAYETLERESNEENREFLHHLAHLTLHGFLHLIGYDHETDAQADEMEGLESKIMTRLQMPDPYRDRRNA